MPFLVAVGVLFLMEVTHFYRQLAVENSVAHGSGNQGHAFIGRLVKNLAVGNIYLNQRLQIYCVMEVSQLSFVNAAEAFALAKSALLHDSQIVGAQNHILGRHGNRLAVLRSQNIIYGHHQHTRFGLGFYGQRQMDSHLVAVEVGVVSGTYQRVQLNSAALGQNRLERLNAQSVQRRRTVQQYGVLLDYILKNIPNLSLGAFYLTLSAFDISCQSAGNQTLHNEGLEQL